LGGFVEVWRKIGVEVARYEWKIKSLSCFELEIVLYLSLAI
jgi:hypothetical protein